MPQGEIGEGGDCEIYTEMIGHLLKEVKKKKKKTRKVELIFQNFRYTLPLNPFRLIVPWKKDTHRGGIWF